MTIQVFKQQNAAEFATVVLVISQEDAENLWKQPSLLPIFTKRVESRIANELAIPESLLYPTAPSSSP